MLRFFHFYPNQQKALDARTHPAWTRLKFDELVARVIRCLTRPAGASTLGLVHLK